MRSLISAFVIHLLVCIISIPATSKISIFEVVTVAEETGLKLALSETPKTGFLATRPNCMQAKAMKSHITSKLKKLRYIGIKAIQLSYID